MSTWYRPPPKKKNANIDLLLSFEEFLQKADYEDKEVVITGDFNCNFLSTESITSTPIN
jgi:exonuclease III